MSLDSVERTDAGYLVNIGEWNEEIAAALFVEEEIDATDEHWDVIKYVRQEVLEGDEPNERSIMKAMGNSGVAKLSPRKCTRNSLVWHPSKALKLVVAPKVPVKADTSARQRHNMQILQRVY